MIIYDDDGVGHNVVPMKVIEDIKQEVFNAIDNVPIILSKNDADNLLKMDIQNIIDKHIKGD